MEKEMTVEEAIEKSDKCNKVPMARQCSTCWGWLDEKSKVIVEGMVRIERDKINYVITHGMCESCFEKHKEEIKDIREKIYNNLEKSHD